MKLFAFYLQILLPLPLLVFICKLDSATVFCASLMVYALIYRPLTDAKRLADIGAIKRNEKWKLFIPFYRLNYFYELYFKA